MEPGDDGVTLIEVLVALLVLTTVSLAAASFMVGAVRTTAQQSQKQNATALATSALEAVQALPVDQLVTGRTETAVQSLLTATDFAPLVAEDVIDSDNFDPLATPTSAPRVPVFATQTLAGTLYQVRTSINRCFLSRTTQKCTRSQPSDGVSVVRATVNLRWGNPACRSLCSFSASALVDRQPDPVFQLATSRPIVVSMTPDVVTVGEPVKVTLVGVGFAPGLQITTSEDGEQITNVVRKPTGTEVGFDYVPGLVPGRFTLVLTNPDTGRAEYSSITVLPKANDDCVVVDLNSTSGIPVGSNDVPVGSGSVAITQPPAAGNATTTVVQGEVRYKAPTYASVETLRYTITVNGETSAPATLTIRVQSTPGTC